MTTAQRWIIYGLPFLILLAALQHLFSFYNADNSWLLSVAQRMLDGEALYSDIKETNPPMIVWLNLIPAFIAAQTGLSIANSMTLFVGFASLCSFYIYIRHAPAHLYVGAAAYAMISIFAALNYGQREHFFFIFALPYLLSVLPPNRPTILVGLFASIGFMLKPYFVVFFIVAVVTYALIQRDWRVLFHRAHFACAIPVLLYAFWLVFIDTSYVAMMVPDLLLTYDSMSAPVSYILSLQIPILVVLLAPYLLWVLARCFISYEQKFYVVDYMAALSGAALLTVIIQQKGWGNHWYMVYVTFFCLYVAMAVKLFHMREQSGMLFASCGAIISLSVIAFLHAKQGVEELMSHPIEKVLTDIAPHHPETVYSLTFDLGAAFPATTYLPDAHYVGTYGHFWYLIHYYKNEPYDENNELPYRSQSDMSEKERAWFREVTQEFVRLQPDLVAITEGKWYENFGREDYQFNFVTYYGQDPYFAQLWKQYELVSSYEDVKFYIKKPN